MLSYLLINYYDLLILFINILVLVLFSYYSNHYIYIYKNSLINIYKELIIYIIIFLLFLFIYNYLLFNDAFNFIQIYSYIHINVDKFGYILFFLVIYSTIISLITISNRSNFFFFIFFFFIIITFLIITSNNIIKIFIYYEFLLIPSFILAYSLGYSQRILNASIIFLIWTQLGSLLVFFSIIYILTLTKSGYIYYLNFFFFTQMEKKLLYFLFFFGFGIKVPIWPFHYWLTKVHVESVSGFSIFLSGFLVKTAVYCFYRFNQILQLYDYSYIYIFICVFGIADSSLKFWGQVDLKKMIAYATIQEMNIIYMLFIINSIISVKIGYIFVYTHALLSSIMFFIIELIYKRYKTRSVYKLKNIIYITPNLGKCILIMLFVYLGLPLSIKFYVEFSYLFILYLYSFNLSLYIGFFLLVLGNIGFSKNIFYILYRNSSNFKQTNLPLDLNYNELFFFFITIFLLIIPIIINC